MEALDITAKTRWDELDKDRGSTIDRAELCAKLTLPYLFMEEGSSAQDDLSREYVQGFGATLVNHLTGKFALSILPADQPFFRLSPTEEAMEAITGDDKAMKLEVESILAKKEQSILRYINKSKFRDSLYPALKIAIVTGDSLIEKLDDETYRVLSMRNYCIKRDASGNILDLVIKETIDYDALPEEIQGTIDDKAKDEPVDLYTRLYLEEGVYKMYQEADEETISGSETDVKNFADRFISIRWNKVDGEDYGRGKVEDHLGTFIHLNKNLKVIDEGTAVAVKSVGTVNPNGMTKYKDYVNAANGDVIIGQATDIGFVDTGDIRSLQFLEARVGRDEEMLSQGFLMFQARDSERTTAYEVSVNTRDIDTSFGGQYTAMASDIQVPVVENAMKTLKIDAGKDVEVIITAGVEALGRSVELNKTYSFIDGAARLGQVTGAEAIAKAVDVNIVLASIVANSGVAGQGFIFSQASQDQQEIAGKEEAMAQQLAQGGLGQAGANVANQMTGGQ